MSQNSHTLGIDGKRVQFQVWDTAGQERFRALGQSYYRGAQGVMVVYSVADQRSFINVDYWLREVQTYAGSRVCKLLVGNKSDLSTSREVTFADGDRKAAQNELGPMQFFETSATTNYNVQEAFVALAVGIRDSGPFSEVLSDYHAPVIQQASRGRDDESCC